jgi:GntR family transcriptional repressor for pyruvate dehydrogenase complex
MSFQVRAVDRTKLYSAIVEQILEGIRNGELPPRSALPAERSLALQLGVSRSSLREALRVLEHAGVLDVRTGSGTFVAEAGSSSAAMLRAQAAAAGEQSPLDVMVARRALEPVCAEHAAINRNARDLDDLRQAVVDQAEAIARGSDPADPDLRFHVSLARATHNPVLALLLEQLVEIMRQSIWRELNRRTDRSPGRVEDFLDSHRAILTAVERRDATAASQAMHGHLDNVERGLIREVES